MFFDFDTLHGEGFFLKKEFTVDADPERDWSPAYHFSICLPDGRKVGRCDLRLGHNDRLYYGGNVGYGVDEPHRGQHLAARHDLGYLIITCDPQNIASRRSCEYAGGTLEEIAQLPEWHDLYQRGMREVCVYRFDLHEVT